MPVSVTLEGPLSKWTNMIHGWQFRWFVLDQLNGLLSYYTSKENMSKGERRGCIRLKDAFVGIDNEDDITFTITVDDKTFHLQARNLDEREKWVSKVEKTIILHSSSSANNIQNTRKNSQNKLLANSKSGSKSINNNNNNNNNVATASISSTSIDNTNDLGMFSIYDDLDLKNLADFRQFDSSLAESDAYLQLMIEQLKTIEDKRNNLLIKKAATTNTNNESPNTTLTSSTSTSNTDNNNNANNNTNITSALKSTDFSNDEENDNPDLKDNSEALDSIILSTENLIETLKHAIVCLQIAKANCDPSNVIDSTQDLKEVLSHFDETNDNKLLKSKQQQQTMLNNNLSSSTSLSNNQNNNNKQPNEIKNNISSANIINNNININNHTNQASNNKNEKDLNINTDQNKTKKKKLQMPVASYSSSDEESEQNKNAEASLAIKGKNKQQKDHKIVFDYVDDDDDDDDDDIDDEDAVTVNENDFYESNLIENESEQDDDNDSESFYDAIDQNVASSYSIEKSNDSNEILVKSSTTAITTIINSNNGLVDSTTKINTTTITATQNPNNTAIISIEGDELINQNEKKSNNNTNNILNSTDSNNSSNLQILHHDSSSTISNSNSTIELLPKLERNLSEFDLIDYDEDVLQDDVDINSQQSVITHLLTQVRIGMDLTKITLPTFILEPRSLLEMYADFFAHTDMFLEIADISNPRDRMIQVVRWYMSTFHAGRKSPVAKKPYNPILGEIFQCWYTIPPSTKTSTSTSTTERDKTLVEDGPVPWADRDQLTFIAEQVSHHPPISAFYAEHYNKRMQLAGYTWTKSKFLGLSIGVHMVGKAVLSLLDLDEEYIFTFPSAYGRSILTVPWFEMGGQVSITCAKTGYYSNIDFLTKPFYGGKKHQISGTINSPDKKVLYTIDGDWNGTMFIRSGGKTDILISTQSTPTIKKQVRPVSEQDDNESRRLWREVTYYLRTKNIELATAGKQRIEQNQRNDVKHRKETNKKWQTKYFEEQGENWVYIKPLVKRLLHDKNVEKK